MAFVTYTIVSSVIYGLRGRFHPENLGYTASRALAIVFIEFSAVKLGCYLLNIQGDHTIFDLVAYSGYKFVGTLLVLAVGMLQLGRWMYWLTFFYVFAANAFFLVRFFLLLMPAPLAALRRLAGPFVAFECDGHASTACHTHSVPVRDRHVPDRIWMALDCGRVLSLASDVHRKHSCEACLEKEIQPTAKFSCSKANSARSKKK